MASVTAVPLWTPQRFGAFLAVAIAMAMSVLDSSIVNVALPSIAAQFDIAAREAIWIVNGYQLVITVCLLPLSSLGDIWGYKRVYCWGLALFTVASLLCALSTGLTSLLTARILQGLGAAGIMSVNLALVRFIFPQSVLGRAVGITALVVAVSSATGPSIAAAILSLGNWQWLFLVNVPLGVVALTAGIRLLPDSTPSGARFDWLSALWSAGTFGLLITGLDGIGGEAWQTPALMLIGALICGVLLTRRQLKLPMPMLAVDLLKNGNLALTMATSICAFSAQMLVYISLPFYFHDILGHTAVQTGLLMTPWPLATALSAPVAGRLADHYTPARLGGIGLGLMALGLLLLLLMPAQPPAWDIAWRLAVCGLGFGTFQSPNNKAILMAFPKHRSGSASGMQSTARLLGQSMGAAIAATSFALAGGHKQVWVALTLGVVMTATGALTSSLRRFEK